MGESYVCTLFFEMPESETDPMLESRDYLETRKDAEVGPLARPLDRAAVDFTAPNFSCEIMITGATTL